MHPRICVAMWQVLAKYNLSPTFKFFADEEAKVLESVRQQRGKDRCVWVCICLCGAVCASPDVSPPWCCEHHDTGTIFAMTVLPP